jgi:phage antirepressor YoqD-like protein
MSNIIPFNTMTSMEIAEVTGKLHAHIMRDIRDEIEKLEAGGIPIESKFGLVSYKDSKGEVRPCYQLSKEGVLQLAARYDAVVRAKLIEMVTKQEQQIKVPQTFAEALRLAADLEEQRQKLLPKAEYYDDMAERNHLTNFRDTAKELKMKETDFTEILETTGHVYRDSKGRIKPYAEYVPTLFEIKEFVAKNGFASNQTLITHKGREKFRVLTMEGKLCQSK